MIEVTPDVLINENELSFDFIRSSGPGGQNVNKVASGVQLRFNVDQSTTLPEEIKHRLRRLAGSRITADGVLVIEAKRYRSQEQNRADAIARLVSLIYQASQKPKPRRKTKPTAAAQAERLEAKKRRGAIKRARRTPPSPLE